VWRLLPDVRERERPRFAFFFLLFVLLAAAEALGLAAADSLFLARVGITGLPLAFVAAAVAALVASLVYGALVDVHRNDVLFVALLGVGAAALGGVGAAAALGHAWAYPALLCLFHANRTVFLTHYWTFAGDHFDALSSKRIFGLLAIGSSVGGMAGGALAAGLSLVVRTEWLIAAWAGCLVGAAGLVFARREQLRRAVPLEAMESDDPSVTGLRGAARYLRGTVLGRWLVVSCAAMVVALFVAQYAYLGIFARAFPDAQELAFFFGVYLGVANLVEALVGGVVGRWLLPVVGVPTANLVHPSLTVASFAALAAAPGVPAALVSRANRELLENALANPVRNLSYNALPQRHRGRVRAFLEGIVWNLAMAGSGVVLVFAAPSASLAWICAVGGAAGALYLLANARVRTAYAQALVDEIASGQLDLREIEGGIGRRETALVAAFWDSLVRDAGRPPARSVDRMARMLARHGLGDRLREALGHASPRVRRAALEALLDGEAPEREAILAAALADPEPSLRGVALAALRASAAALAPALTPGVRACLDAADPRVRAGAAALLGREGGEVLRAMLRGRDPVAAAAALRALPESELPLAVEHAGAPAPEVRAAALQRLADADGAAAGIPPELVRAGACDPDPRVRAAALRLLGSGDDPECAVLLGERLGDPAREVRRLAARSLARLGAPALAQAGGRIDSDRAGEFEAAGQVLAELGSAAAGDRLRAAYAQRARDAWRALLALRAVPEEGPLAPRFLRVALADALGRSVRFALALLARIEDPRAVRSLERALRLGSPRERADALEALSHLGEREASRLLVALLEEGPLEERAPLAASLVGAPRGLDDALGIAASLGRHARAAAAACRAGHPVDAASEVLMERLLLLRTIPLFAHMSLEQLEAIDALLREAHYVQGETIFREGDPGDELLVILEGEVDFSKRSASGSDLHLATFRAGSWFGDMAVLSDEPRSATARARTPARILSLRGDRLKELVLEMPELSFEIFRELAARLRAADRRLEEQRGGSSARSSPREPRSGAGSGS
jgi:HEAT repeat protein